MQKLITIAVLAVMSASPTACRRSKSDPQQAATDATPGAITVPKDPAAARPLPRQIPPPMDVAQPPADALKTASGIYYKVLVPPTGETKLGPTDAGLVNYTLWRTSGEMITTTEGQGGPQPWLAKEQPPGLQEALLDMKLGEKRILWIPPELMSPDGRPRPKEGIVVVQVELAGIDPPPAVPPDVAAPPADAVKTPSGLSYKVLQQGTGTVRPQPWDQVNVYSTLWTADGRLVDRTLKGAPRIMSLLSQPQGFSEAVQLMVPGQKNRVWIPESLREPSPFMREDFAVCDIELVKIQKLPAPPPVPEDVAAPPEGAKKIPMGAFYKVLQQGTSTDKPQPWDEVSVQYTNWTSDGRLRGRTLGGPRPMRPIEEPRYLSEVLQLMAPGQKNRLWVPESLRGELAPGMPKGLMVWDIEVVEVKKQQVREPPPAPNDVAAPPNDAQKTAKGVFYKVLKKGTGKEHPTEDTTVKAHWTGWTTDGRVFESTLPVDKPRESRVRNMRSGLSDGLQVMVVGETTRFWIPEELAFKGAPNRPKGMVVFDVELLEMVDTP